MTLNSGDILNGRYRIASLVGQGGFGAVYRAWDTVLRVPVAVKENLDTSPEAQRQFEHEALLLAPLRHSNLPRVTDHFFLPGQGQYLVMDFVEGKSLDVILAERGGPLSEAEALGWIGQVCDALDYLHTRTPPIIHRDIKPQNIIITADGRAMLVDFGISKAYDPQLTTTRGARAVTAGYSPPEQYGQGKTDARSDVYALGATLYTLLTGQPPPESVALISGNEAIVPVRQANPGVSATTEGAITAAMALSVSRRLGSAVVLKEALAGRGLAVAPEAAAVGARTVAIGPQDKRRSGVSPLLLIGGLVAVAVIAVAIIFLLRGSGGGPSNDDPSTAVAGDPAATNEGRAVVATPTEPPAEPVEAAVKTPTTPADPMAVSTSTIEALTVPVLGDRRVIELSAGPVAQVFVPEGTLAMGSDTADSETDERPVHTVNLDAFWIDETEVTNAQFAAFLTNAGIDSGLFDSWIDIEDEETLIDIIDDGFVARPGFETHPVIEVPWAGAAAFCEWAGGRLPTEAEWEYAARGPEGRVYPWGDVFECHLLNADDENLVDDYVGPGGVGCDGFNRTAPVGNFPQGASWVGALDMAGNVWEWTNDWYDEAYYAASPSDNPSGPAAGARKVMRGGSWFKGYISDRATFRLDAEPTVTLNDGGFRCVYDVAPDLVDGGAVGVVASPVPEPTATPFLVAGATRIAPDPRGRLGIHVYVPASTFRMGSDDGNNDERPIHQVTLDAFWLDRTEISNAQFAAFVDATAYETTAERQGWGYLFDGGNWDVVNGADWQHPQGPGSDIAGLDDHPVVLVNRADAAAFCAWAGGRLPTEAEWEYAARGPENRLWAWGDEFLSDRVNYCDHDCSASWADLDVDDGYSFTAPVESFPDGASWVGALNMTGNVWEWVADWYAADYYSRSPDANPPGPETGERGILRGGSWVFEPRRVRATDRNSTDPAFAINDFGIRCAYDAD